MDRRTFVKTAGMGSLALGLGACMPKNPSASHILTLSFDDGFIKSFRQIADIHEAFGLRACFNVIAAGHLPEFQGVDHWIQPDQMGNFDDWNALVRRGHEVMPHSWKHLNLTEQPFPLAQELIVKCLDYFEANLEGYKASEAVFNFPFNASNPDLEKFVLGKVRALRSQGDTSLNPFPDGGNAMRLGCWSHGPNNVDAWVEEQVNAFLNGSGGWQILNLHGLEGEGWGPISPEYLTELLARLSQVPYLDILPSGVVLRNSLA